MFHTLLALDIYTSRFEILYFKTRRHQARLVTIFQKRRRKRKASRRPIRCRVHNGYLLKNTRDRSSSKQYFSPFRGGLSLPRDNTKNSFIAICGRMRFIRRTGLDTERRSKTGTVAPHFALSFDPKERFHELPDER